MPLTATWMDTESAMLSEVSQTRKGKYSMTCLYVGRFKGWSDLMSEGLLGHIFSDLMLLSAGTSAGIVVCPCGCLCVLAVWWLGSKSMHS